MNCPDCNTPMTGENVPIIHATKLAPGYTNPESDPQVGIKIPHSHYRCEGCDSEWVWTRVFGRNDAIVGELRKLDGAVRFTLADARSSNYDDLTPQEQWEEDRELGLLDE